MRDKPDWKHKRFEIRQDTAHGWVHIADRLPVPVAERLGLAFLKENHVTRNSKIN